LVSVSRKPRHPGLILLRGKKWGETVDETPQASLKKTWKDPSQVGEKRTKKKNGNENSERGGIDRGLGGMAGSDR